VVYSKPPFAGPEEVVRYIGRYSHRVAISNHRIISISDGKIRFSYKDNKEKDKRKKWKEMELPADQFIERFLWHVLPNQFHRVRHFGFLTNNKKGANLEIIRSYLLSSRQVEALPEKPQFEDSEGLNCPRCGKGKMRSYLVLDKYGRVLKLDISAFMRAKPPDGLS
jgi:hypothetical protein